LHWQPSQRKQDPGRFLRLAATFAGQLWDLRQIKSTNSHRLTSEGRAEIDQAISTQIPRQNAREVTLRSSMDA
jgi:hypothetical protein